MKKTIILLTLLCLSLVLKAQEVKIVFDVTSSDEQIHQAAVRHVGLMSEAYPDSEFELVVYSGALAMVLDDKSAVRDQLLEIAARDNVSVNVCAMTLKRHEMNESHLVKGVGTVPDGILEIVQRQAEGWGYIKEAF